MLYDARFACGASFCWMARSLQDNYHISNVIFNRKFVTVTLEIAMILLLLLHKSNRTHTCLNSNTVCKTLILQRGTIILATTTSFHWHKNTRTCIVTIYAFALTV